MKSRIAFFAFLAAIVAAPTFAPAQQPAQSLKSGQKDKLHGVKKPGSPRVAPSASASAPHALLAAPSCAPMSLTTTNFAGGGGAITPPGPGAVSSFTTIVAGAGAYLWDVNLLTTITHTWNADLEITLQSPAGTTVTITTDNGGGDDDVFNGTIWDGNVNFPCTDYLYTNLVAAPALSPEGSFSAFRGEDPNGAWTLSILDDATIDVGNLAAWSLDISTLAAAPVDSTSTFSFAPALPILDLATVSDSQLLGGLPTWMDKVVLYVEITHTWNSDLEITLSSPGGSIVAVTTGNGGGNDNVFNGTTFDPAGVDVVGDHAYANLVVATPLSPEGSFDNFLGEDPNGLWTITITDTAGGDVGTLIRWDLSVTTTAPVVTPLSGYGPGTTGPIPDYGGVVAIPTVYNLPVSGLSTRLWDVDLTTAITHTDCGDLDITLTSPAGTVVTISTDNANSYDDCFNGTLWDDNINDPATYYPYVDTVAATPLSPEGRLSAFRGENPNGNWKLTITDDAPVDIGSLASWALDFTTMPWAPVTDSNTFSNSPGLPIAAAAPNIVSDTMLLGGLNPYMLKVELYLEVTHTYSSDLLITLMSPGGSSVVLSYDNSGDYDDVFNGTLFSGGVTDTVTDHIYTDLVVATPLSPEGSFDNFIGEDPNGLWTLTVDDGYSLDGGTFVRWDLTIDTCAPVSSASVCVPGVGGVLACPCANPPSGADRGCDNREATGGASITGYGSNSLSTPTLFFVTGYENASVLSIMIQGTVLTTGSVFGHGVRCMTTFKRLFQKVGSGGSVTMPAFPIDANIPMRSGVLGDTILAGQMRVYQVYYRDNTLTLPGCPLPAARFTATSGAQIFWVP